MRDGETLTVRGVCYSVRWTKSLDNVRAFLFGKTLVVAARDKAEAIMAAKAILEGAEKLAPRGGLLMSS